MLVRVWLASQSCVVWSLAWWAILASSINFHNLSVRARICCTIPMILLSSAEIWAILANGESVMVLQLDLPIVTNLVPFINDALSPLKDVWFESIRASLTFSIWQNYGFIITPVWTAITIALLRFGKCWALLALRAVSSGVASANKAYLVAIYHVNVRLETIWAAVTSTIHLDDLLFEIARI